MINFDQNFLVSRDHLLEIKPDSDHFLMNQAAISALENSTEIAPIQDFRDKLFSCSNTKSSKKLSAFLFENKATISFAKQLYCCLDKVIGYKNPDLRDYLISKFSEFNFERFEVVLSEKSGLIEPYGFTQSQIDNIQLMILAVEGLSINSSIKESIFKAFKNNYRLFKDYKKQKSILQLMQLIDRNLDLDKFYEKIVFILQKKENLFRNIQLCQVIIKNNPQAFLDLDESHLDIRNLSKIVLKQIEQFCPSKDESDNLRLLDTIMNLRDFGCIFLYASNFWNEYEGMKLAIQKLFKGIADPKQFIIDRNNESPHLKRVSSEVKKNWTTPLTPIENIFIEDSKVKIDIRAFLKEKLIIEGNANGNFENLIETIQKEKEPSQTMTDLESQIYQLIDLKEDQLVTELESIQKKMKTEQLTHIEFYHDVQGLIQQLNSKLSSIKKFTLVDSDDIQDLLYCGTEVDGSCLRLDGSPDTNCCLMGYVLDGKIRLLAIKNKGGRIVSRAIIKLLFNNKNEPVIFFEMIYGREEFLEKLLEYAHKKAEQLGVSLYTAGGNTKLASIGNVVPYEYEDEEVGVYNEFYYWGVSNGVYTIKGQLA